MAVSNPFMLNAIHNISTAAADKVYYAGRLQKGVVLIGRDSQLDEVFCKFFDGNFVIKLFVGIDEHGFLLAGKFQRFAIEVFPFGWIYYGIAVSRKVARVCIESESLSDDGVY